MLGFWWGPAWWGIDVGFFLGIAPAAALVGWQMARPSQFYPVDDAGRPVLSGPRWVFARKGQTTVERREALQMGAWYGGVMIAFAAGFALIDRIGLRQAAYEFWAG